MTRPRLFVELCAGLAAVSLRLQGGPRCRPPVSRMGNKAGYAQAILAAMGLRSGEGAEGYLWCEPDDGCRALLQAYGQPEVLADAAEVIRGWADEAPRALWERLRAEGPIRGVDGREVARWACLQGGTFNSYPIHVKPPTPDYNRWPGGKHPGTWPSDIATRLASLPALPPTVVGADARVVDPREVARWCFVAGGSMKGVGMGPFGGNLEGWEGTAHGQGTKRPLSARLPDALTRLASLPALPPTVVGADAREVEPPRLDGVYVYIDPPYVNTTGYGADLSRAEVVAMARRWSEAGAVVAISEQEPVVGWADDLWPVDITETRKGQRRTFSRQTTEILTLNRPPVEKPAEQIPLFALGAV